MCGVQCITITRNEPQGETPASHGLSHACFCAGPRNWGRAADLGRGHSHGVVARRGGKIAGDSAFPSATAASDYAATERATRSASIPSVVCQLRRRAGMPKIRMQASAAPPVVYHRPPGRLGQSRAALVAAVVEMLSVIGVIERG
jgi:hypothetical protein